jgi:hypothetical protein
MNEINVDYRLRGCTLSSGLGHLACTTGLGMEDDQKFFHWGKGATAKDTKITT